MNERADADDRNAADSSQVEPGADTSAPPTGRHRPAGRHRATTRFTRRQVLDAAWLLAKVVWDVIQRWPG